MLAGPACQNDDQPTRDAKSLCPFRDWLSPDRSLNVIRKHLKAVAEGRMINSTHCLWIVVWDREGHLR